MRGKKAKELRRWSETLGRTVPERKYRIVPGRITVELDSCTRQIYKALKGISKAEKG